MVDREGRSVAIGFGAKKTGWVPFEALRRRARRLIALSDLAF
jgi:hypothetical protein